MLKLTLEIGDIVELYDAVAPEPWPVRITIDRTRPSGARLVVRDGFGNGVDAWLEVADNIHLEGYFNGPARVELDRTGKRKIKLIFDVPPEVRITRIPTAEQAEPAALAAESESA